MSSTSLTLPDPLPRFASLDHDPQDTATDARRVRTNLLRAIWSGIGQLTRRRKWLLFVRLAISLVQILALTPFLFLGSSHGGSYTPGEYCNPQPMFIFLLLYVLRLAAILPCDLYLGLSPHRASASQHHSHLARYRLERNRAFGSLLWDSRISKLSNLLGFLGIVLFIIGNFVVFSSSECSEPPADSVPLFFASLAALIVGYVVILEIIILLFLVACAVPLLILILRALGMGDRVATRFGPKHATGKVAQSVIDERVKLVYFTPAKEDGEATGNEARERGARRSLDELREATNGGLEVQVGQGAVLSRTDALIAASVMLPPSRPMSPTVAAVSGSASSDLNLSLFRTGTAGSVGTRASSKRQRRAPAKLARLQRLFFARQALPRPLKSEATSSQQQQSQLEPQEQQEVAIPAHRRRTLKYPLHPIPEHRAMCTICLSDFEEPSLDLQDEEPEPLRLLECGHVLHKSCVDEWFTTVSARCPVCQKPIVEPEEAGRADAGGDTEAQQRREQGERDAPPPPAIPMAVLQMLSNER
ncbi:hypothetical protein ACQY0O_000792 [Thecaphora frezii]